MSSAANMLNELTDAEFQAISNLVKDFAGINLHEGKRELVKARLNKRLRALGMTNFQQYLDYVQKDPGGEEFVVMLDALSTNLTFFFREPEHFKYLSGEVLPGLLKRNAASKRIRVWSAGCSSGEEPYSIALLLSEFLADKKGWDARVLATDLSTRVLGVAKRGIYEFRRLKDVPSQCIGRYFECVDSRERLYQVKPALRSMVTFGRLNLMGDWPMKGPFDVIFCRNVMIYFDKPTQGALVNRYGNLLAPGGTLFLGHSESLTGIRHGFKYVKPTVYQKN